MEPGVPYAALHYKVLEIDRNKALKGSRGAYDVPIELSELAKTELNWWVDNIESSWPVEIEEPDIILKSDASK